MCATTLLHVPPDVIAGILRYADGFTWLSFGKASKGCSRVRGLAVKGWAEEEGMPEDVAARVALWCWTQRRTRGPKVPEAGTQEQGQRRCRRVRLEAPFDNVHPVGVTRESFVTASGACLDNDVCAYLTSDRKSVGVHKKQHRFYSVGYGDFIRCFSMKARVGLAMAGSSGRVEIKSFRHPTEDIVIELAGATIHAVCAHSDTVVALVVGSGSYYVYDRGTCVKEEGFMVCASKRWAMKSASLTEHRAALTRGGTLEVWDLSTKQVIWSCSSSSSGVAAVCGPFLLRHVVTPMRNSSLIVSALCRHPFGDVYPVVSSSVASESPAPLPYTSIPIAVVTSNAFTAGFSDPCLDLSSVLSPSHILRLACSFPLREGDTCVRPRLSVLEIPLNSDRPDPWSSDDELSTLEDLIV
ncbi:hypothetical protein DIPPA_02893 [Diplonema papillatum]|nr:hypothetical protein DIPPA_02893 [Diplonema papillatum]